MRGTVGHQAFKLPVCVCVYIKRKGGNRISERKIDTRHRLLAVGAQIKNI
jgi:hypothetical protein